MRLKIVQAGEAVLRQRARMLTREEISAPETQRLIEAMRDTMHDAPGVGLAAPQVGLGLQLAIIEDKPEYIRETPAEISREREREPIPFHVIINPEIVAGEEQAEFFEGCLSVTGFTALVRRAKRVKVECLDHTGEAKTIVASGWYARILQHEIDHLHGTLYLDRMYTRSFMSGDNFNRYWKSKPVAEMVELLGLKG